jgi:uncharacterized protein YlzI (FlbEa/FlbD family)
MKRYEEERRLREKRKTQSALATGAAVGLIAGYCAKKYVVPAVTEKVIPKLVELEIKTFLEKEKLVVKDKFDDLKSSVSDFKDKFTSGGCCCCCDDEDCDCDCDEDCEGDCDCDCHEDETSDESEESTDEDTEDKA